MPQSPEVIADVEIAGWLNSRDNAHLRSASQNFGTGARGARHLLNDAVLMFRDFSRFHGFLLLKWIA